MRWLTAIHVKRLLWVLMLSWAVACDALDSTEPTPTVTPVTPTVTSSPTSTPLPTATPSPVPPTSTPTPTPGPLSPAAIFDKVAPSIAHIRTPAAGGSAILIDGGYLLTNAHVVWPYTSVRAVFADGISYEEVPLVAWDLLADLAILGPLPEGGREPLPLMDGEASVVGSDVFLVGYPGEVEAFPEPTITRGLISRRREWETADITFFQTDATIASGQSGGALVSEMGEVIGISGFAFAASEFALVASARDLAIRVEQLIADGDSFTQNPAYARSGSKTHSVRLADAWNGAAFLVADDCSSPLEIEAESEHDIVLQLVELASGEFWEVDDTLTGREWLNASLREGGLHLALVFQFEEDPVEVAVESSCELIALDDPDDQQQLRLEQSIRGSLDFPGDIDVFYLGMDEGEHVSLLVDSVAINPYLLVTYEGAPSTAEVDDDNSGGGLFGLDAELTFRAPHSDRFLVIVADANSMDFGGYEIVTSRYRADAPTPIPMPPTPAPIITEYGPMYRYNNDRYPFTMEIPAEWEETTAFDENCQGRCFTSEQGFLVVAEEDVEALLGDAGASVTRGEYIAMVIENVKSFLPQAVLQSRQSTTTASGVPAEIAHYRWREGGRTIHLETIIAFEEGIGFNALYLVPEEAYGEMAATIAYSFSTLALEGD